MAAEKRKRSSTVRATAARRQSSTPATHTKSPDTRLNDDAAALPAHVAADALLPVLPARQPDDLPPRDYKSVVESKVFTESVVRSERRWVDGDIFTRFWIKPHKSRRLDAVELDKNPPRECMTRKLGVCTMVCAPHRFTVNLYGVTKPVPVPMPPQPPPVYQQPQPQPMPPLTPAPQPQMIPPGQSYRPPPLHVYGKPHVPHQTVPGPGSGPTPQLVNGQIRAAHPPTPAPLPQSPAVTNVQPLAQNRPSAQATPTQTPVARPAMSNGVHPSPQQVQPPAVPPAPVRPDPVIQMLAMKAAHDANLKALMRIVASGRATVEELRIFQGHIDSLQPALQEMARAQAAQGPPGPGQPPPLSMQPMPVQQPSPRTPQYSQHRPPQQQQYSPYQQRPTSYAHQTPARAFPPTPRYQIVTLVFEFAHAHSQGDRFLFPRHSILEYASDGKSLKASFILTRKPLDDTQEYYQPMTVMLESPVPRVLELFRRVVADPETTRTYMKEIMSRLKRVEDSFLAFRLRRDANDPAEEPFTRVELPPLPPRSTRFEARSAVPKDSTPLREARNVGGGTAPRSRPNIKNVKKPLPKPSPSTTASASSANTPTAAATPQRGRAAPAPSAKPNLPPAHASSAPSQSAPPPSSTLAAAAPPPATTPAEPRPPKPPRSRKGRIADPSKSCHVCKTSLTSLWRKAEIDGAQVTVCNACGIKWKTASQKQLTVPEGDGGPGRRKSSGASSAGRPTSLGKHGDPGQSVFDSSSGNADGVGGGSGGGRSWSIVSGEKEGGAVTGAILLPPHQQELLRRQQQEMARQQQVLAKQHLQLNPPPAVAPVAPAMQVQVQVQVQVPVVSQQSSSSTGNPSVTTTT